VSTVFEMYFLTESDYSNCIQVIVYYEHKVQEKFFISLNLLTKPPTSLSASPSPTNN
jgi:hypothetical protein